MNGVESSTFSINPPDRLSTALTPQEHEPSIDSTLLFLMGCSGYFRDNGEWAYHPEQLSDIAQSQEFVGLQRSFFGPVDKSYFFGGYKLGEASARSASSLLVAAFEKPAVRGLIERYTDDYPELAVKVGFLLGGLARDLFIRYDNSQRGEIAAKISFVAEMASLSEANSVEANIAAMAMYIIDGGSIKDADIKTAGEDGESFEDKVLRMAQAIEADPITPTQTRHLGLSQVVRLAHFHASYGSPTPREQDALRATAAESLRPFIGYPTVGAEFHLPIKKADNKVLQQAAILNMSQFHPGSSVQFSRKDGPTFEVRVDPSDFATLQATWNHMRKIFPALDTTNYTITLRRLDRNFAWDAEDQGLLKRLHALSLLIHAAFYSTQPEEIRRNKGHRFAGVYLGQTDALTNNVYDFSGNWGGGRGERGQLGLPVGYGPEMFGPLTYYLSMMLAKSEAFSSLRIGSRSLEDIKDLDDALATPAKDLESLNTALAEIIYGDIQLRLSHAMGRRIRNALA